MANEEAGASRRRLSFTFALRMLPNMSPKMSRSSKEQIPYIDKLHVFMEWGNLLGFVGINITEGWVQIELQIK